MPTRIAPGYIVKNKDGKTGVTVPDFMSCCSPNETPVVYYGTNSLESSPTTELSKLGQENPIADPDACGAGLRANCCIFLTVGPEGFSCERHTAFRYTLQLKKKGMNAKREPVEAYPTCKIFAKEKTGA